MFRHLDIHIFPGRDGVVDGEGDVLGEDLLGERVLADLSGIEELGAHEAGDYLAV
ncbi:MAG: hypothetical protein ACK559_21265 [bacterium]